MFGVFLSDQKMLPCEVYKCIHSPILCENILRMIGWLVGWMEGEDGHGGEKRLCK